MEMLWLETNFMDHYQIPCIGRNLDPHLLFDSNALNLMLPKTKLYFMSSIMSGQPFLMLDFR